MINDLNNTAILVLNDDNSIESNVSVKKLSYLFIKRVFDIIFSIIGLICLLPVIVIVKIISICSGDFKSIFYSQDRIGENGKLFKFYKFRSMVPNADEILKQIMEENGELAQEYKVMKKMSNDPRITKVGKFLRKSSIDELPQLFNILIGDMSFVGNRPYLPREIGDMGNYYDDIVKTRPGLTGFWQASLRSRSTFEERLKMEKYYSNNCGLKFDIHIIFKTFTSVILGKDAK